MLIAQANRGIHGGTIQKYLRSRTSNTDACYMPPLRDYGGDEASDSYKTAGC